VVRSSPGHRPAARASWPAMSTAPGASPPPVGTSISRPAIHWCPAWSVVPTVPSSPSIRRPGRAGSSRADSPSPTGWRCFRTATWSSVVTPVSTQVSRWCASTGPAHASRPD
jgi:hypothetical protein